jgi:hypothetical protein
VSCGPARAASTLARAVETLIAAVTGHRKHRFRDHRVGTIARSYWLQAQHQFADAVDAAQVPHARRAGFAQARLAELQFSEGRARRQVLRQS